MKVGTKSLLFGVHCWFIHPIFVFQSWWKLYGFPKDIRLWIAFIVHDWGYWGKADMDGKEGERHVELGAELMGKWFDYKPCPNPSCSGGEISGGDNMGSYRLKCNWEYHDKGTAPDGLTWYEFCLYHSRFYAKENGANFSKLCVADKLAIHETPIWLYLPLANLSGEIKEYMDKCAEREGKYATMNLASKSQIIWYRELQDYIKKWVIEHKDGGVDTWTPERVPSEPNVAREEVSSF